jgi:molybdopterin molybdotransferase
MLFVKSLTEALEMIRAAFLKIDKGVEVVSLNDAIGRILAEDMSAREDNPSFTRSALDGYAVRAADTFGASESVPAMLTFAGEVLMKQRPSQDLEAGQGIYVPTGGCLPKGADAIAMIEIAEKMGDQILVMESVAPSTGVVFQGDDAKAGDIVLKKGQVLETRHIGTLAALGYPNVPVACRVKCAIISTGDELVPIETPLEDSLAAIRDVNSHLLGAQAETYGCEVHSYGICIDDEVKLSDTIKKAYDECDLVLVSGGSSVGVMDFTKKVFEEAIGAEILMHGIALRPGKPTIVAKAGAKALVGLPGHPVSAFFVMNEVVRPIVDALKGMEEIERPFILAKIEEKIPSNHGREDFVPVMVKKNGENIIAKPLPYKSGLIALLSQSDGYIRISRLAEGLDAGTEVKVYKY